ncbi:MAG: cupin domain-containing protein [Polymorphobacter sp.]|uniref:cupin domain-containing protein n=1 Tax=Polymorphobacter sp. TaxID=1909290 RepID=UPI003A841013
MVTGRIDVVMPSEIDWSEVMMDQIGRPFFIKPLLDEPDTGMSVVMLRYPAGLTNPHHSHGCGHGMYVLEGTLVTHNGEFGPGSFVWFPEGEAMQHGASPEGDMVALFITNKPFTIDYAGDGAET